MYVEWGGVRDKAGGPKLVSSHLPLVGSEDALGKVVV